MAPAAPPAPARTVQDRVAWLLRTNRLYARDERWSRIGSFAAAFHGGHRALDLIAIEWLEKAFEERSPWLTTIAHPEWDVLRTDRRFRALAERMHLTVTPATGTASR